MRHSSLLEQIEGEAIDGNVVKALRLCLSLGGKAGNSDLRDWAAHELNGYRGEDTPEYRKIYAPLQIDGVTIRAIITGQAISTLDLPEFAREHITDEVDLRHSLPGLADLVEEAKRSQKPIRLSPANSQELVTYMNGHSTAEFSRIERLYWAISPSAVQGVIDRVRSNLVELVAEMRAGMPANESIPSREVTAQALSVVVGGSRNRVSVNRAKISQASSVPNEEKSRFRRWLEDGAWIAGIVGAGVLVVLNWESIAG